MHRIYVLENLKINLVHIILIVSLRKNNCTAFLSIMRGCNMRCSYCIVPKTRSNEPYRPMEDIFKEVEFLAQNGVKETTLLGQIVNNYGAKKMPTVSGETPFV